MALTGQGKAVPQQPGSKGNCCWRGCVRNSLALSQSTVDRSALIGNPMARRGPEDRCTLVATGDRAVVEDEQPKMIGS